MMLKFRIMLVLALGLMMGQAVAAPLGFNQ